MDKKRVVAAETRYQDIGDPDLFSRAWGQRGPGPGEGWRGHGRPFGGIVERTPCIWIDWILGPLRRLNKPVDSIKVIWHGVELQMVPIQVGFGTRWYFLCPRCFARREALYFNGRVGCRGADCLHLGYLSQCHRKTSAWPALDMLLSRRWPAYRRYEPTNNIEGLVVELRERLQSEIDAIVAALRVEAKGPQTGGG